MSVLIFLAVLFVLVLVHELGHFAVAKWTKMRVDEFGIGFPPKLFGVKWGETEYTLNLFPIGGFVKIFGEDGTNVPSSPVPSEMRDRRHEAEAEAGGGGEGESISENPDYSRSFVGKNKWAQAAVLLAGVTMNVVFAWLLVVIAFSIGVKGHVDEHEATAEALLAVTNVLPESPAALVGIPTGATLMSVSSGDDTISALTPSAFSAFVDEHRSDPILIVYAEGDEMRVVEVNPVAGILPSDPGRPAVGVALSLLDTIERPLGAAIVEATRYTVTGLRDITLGIWSLVYDAVRFQADLSQVAGPVGIVGLVGDASAYGVASLLLFTAFISLNLAVINILPFPALDGGRLLFVVVEGVVGSTIPARVAGALNLAGFALLILLMVAVTWNDIARLI